MFWDSLITIKGIVVSFMVGILLGALSAGIPVYIHEIRRIDLVKQEFKGFVEETERIGLSAKNRMEQQEKINKESKEKADNEYKTAIATLNADNERMRKQRAGRSFLPPAAPTARSTDQVCFNRHDLDQAIRKFDSGIRAILGQGDDAVIRLKITQEWANGR